MNSFSKYLPIALLIAFFLLGLNVFLESRPSHKNERVYKSVKEYSPYYIEKRFGGLEILSKKDKEFKEKPSNESFFKVYEELEKKWAKTHLRLNGNKLLILDDNNKTLKSLELKSKDEFDFVKNYYGI